MGRSWRARTRPSLLTVLVVGVVGALGAGCGSVGSSPRDYAQAACDAYRHTGRDQISTTVDQGSAIRDLARSNARAAAAFDPSWEDLNADLQHALDLQERGQDAPIASSDDFFEVDRQVQDDCSDAGRDIGDLEP